MCMHDCDHDQSISTQNAYKMASFVGPTAVRGNDDDIWLKARFLISKNKTNILHEGEIR